MSKMPESPEDSSPSSYKAAANTASVFKHPFMDATHVDTAQMQQKLTTRKIGKQAFSLFFALQGMKKFSARRGSIGNQALESYFGRCFMHAYFCRTLF